MTNKYKIYIIDYSKHKNITADNYLEIGETIYKDSFSDVVDYLGGRPHR